MLLGWGHVQLASKAQTLQWLQSRGSHLRLVSTYLIQSLGHYPLVDDYNFVRMKKILIHLNVETYKLIDFYFH